MTPAIRFLKTKDIDFTTHSYECEVHEDFGLHAASQLGLPAEQVYKTLSMDRFKASTIKRSKCFVDNF